MRKTPSTAMLASAMALAFSGSHYKGGGFGAVAVTRPTRKSDKNSCGDNSAIEKAEAKRLRKMNRNLKVKP